MNVQPDQIQLSTELTVTLFAVGFISQLQSELLETDTYSITKSCHTDQNGKPTDLNYQLSMTSRKH